VELAQGYSEFEVSRHAENCVPVDLPDLLMNLLQVNGRMTSQFAVPHTHGNADDLHTWRCASGTMQLPDFYI
jgi:hypothetical protein